MTSGQSPKSAGLSALLTGGVFSLAACVLPHPATNPGSAGYNGIDRSPVFGTTVGYELETGQSYCLRLADAAEKNAQTNLALGIVGGVIGAGLAITGTALGPSKKADANWAETNRNALVLGAATIIAVPTTLFFARSRAASATAQAASKASVGTSSMADCVEARSAYSGSRGSTGDAALASFSKMRANAVAVKTDAEEEKDEDEEKEGEVEEKVEEAQEKVAEKIDTAKKAPDNTKAKAKAKAALFEEAIKLAGDVETAKAELAEIRADIAVQEQKIELSDEVIDEANVQIGVILGAQPTPAPSDPSPK